MGYSADTMALFMQMKDSGLFDGIKRAADIGSQEMHFSDRDGNNKMYREIIRRAIEKLGGKRISDQELEPLANRASTREFYKLIGLEYKSFDADGWYDKPFDFNFDAASEKDRGAYCLTVNAGTTEHLLNQLNVFKVIHDLTRKGGLMLHAGPFLGAIDHGFFSYQPNLFWALARFNSYEMLGMWIKLPGSTSIIPWSMETCRHLNLRIDEGASVPIVCLMRKIHDQEFCVPFQAGYEGAQATENLARYNYVVDGRLMSGVDAYRISQSQQSIQTIPGRTLLTEMKRRLLNRLGIRR